MKGSIKKQIPWLIVIACITILVLIVLFSLNDIKSIGEVLSGVKWVWVIAAFGLLFLYMFLNAIPLYIFGRSDGGEKISFLNSQLIGGLEYFFDAVTPFSSGGQPFQVYSYTRIGVKPSRSTGIILMNFVCFQIALVIMCFCSLFFYNELSSGGDIIKIMIIIGLTMNTLILLLFEAVGLSKKIANILTKIVGWFAKWRIWKGKLNSIEAKFEAYCMDAQRTFKALQKHKFRFILCVIIKALSLISQYSIPFFIFKALNYDIGIESLPVIIAMTTFAIAMTCYIPTPGATGGIEFAFKSLFIVIVAEMTEATAVSGMMIWRFVTYYIFMLISLIIYIIFCKIAKNPSENIENKPLTVENSSNVE